MKHQEPITSRPARILVVDDERHIARLIQFVLQKEGYQVGVAHTGEQAVAMVKEKCPDAVLLDLVMPDISGLDVLRELKAYEPSRDVPIALLTARSFEAEPEGLAQSGVTFHCTKPVAPSTLLKKLSDFGVPPIIESPAR